jgi:hypothetical protein
VFLPLGFWPGSFSYGSFSGFLSIFGGGKKWFLVLPRLVLERAASLEVSSQSRLLQDQEETWCVQFIGSGSLFFVQ